MFIRDANFINLSKLCAHAFVELFQIFAFDFVPSENSSLPHTCFFFAFFTLSFNFLHALNFILSCSFSKKKKHFA